MSDFPAPYDAVVVGASGGLGAALAGLLDANPQVARVHRFSRGGPVPLDLLDEASIAAAAATVAETRLVIVATGRLHGQGVAPEKRIAAIDAEGLARSFQVNAIGPALVLKHFGQRLPRDGKSVMAVLSARVGSIADNQLGGWYGYRASKAALNQLMRTAAVELAIHRKDAICVALHPGTVDTPLSKPFQRGVPAGKLFAPADAAAQLLAVIENLSPCDTGSFRAWDGSEIPF